MASMEDLAALLAVGNDPSTLETGFGLQSTSNVFAAPYYQAERLRRQNMRADPNAIAAMQAQMDAERRHDLQLEGIKQLGDVREAQPGIAGVTGIPWLDQLFAMNAQAENAATRAGAAANLGTASNQAAAGGQNPDDILTQLLFDPLSDITPTSVRAAAVRGASGDDDDPPMADASGMDWRSGIDYRFQVPRDEAIAALTQSNPLIPGGDISDGSPAAGQVDPVYITQLQRRIASIEGTPTGEPQVVVRNGQRILVVPYVDVNGNSRIARLDLDA